MSNVEIKRAQLARRSHGVATRRELLDAGITRREINHRLRSGALIAVFRGVYRVGHTAPSFEADYMAAVRACGNGALLSGRAAGYLPCRVEGLRTRRARRSPSLWRGIPTTTVADTIIDLAGVLEADDLARAWHEAGIRYHAKPQQVEAALANRPNAPGAGELRKATAALARPTPEATSSGATPGPTYSKTQAQCSPSSPAS